MFLIERRFCSWPGAGSQIYLIFFLVSVCVCSSLMALLWSPAVPALLWALLSVSVALSDSGSCGSLIWMLFSNSGISMCSSMGASSASFSIAWATVVVFVVSSAVGISLKMFSCLSLASSSGDSLVLRNSWMGCCTDFGDIAVLPLMWR